MSVGWLNKKNRGSAVHKAAMPGMPLAESSPIQPPIVMAAPPLLWPAFSKKAGYERNGELRFNGSMSKVRADGLPGTTDFVVTSSIGWL